MRRIGSEVERELSRFGPAAGLAELVERWPAAVGDAVSRNAWPARFQRDGTLIVHTSSAAWAFELTQLESQVAELLGDLAPSRLRFVPGPLPADDAVSPAEATRPRVTASPEERAHAGALAAAIDDETLRKLVARAAAADLARTRSARRF